MLPMGVYREYLVTVMWGDIDHGGVILIGILES